MPEILIHDRQGTVTVRESPGLALLEKFWVELEMEDGAVITSCQSGLAFDSGKWTCRLQNSRLKLDLDIRNVGNPRGILVNVRVRNEGNSDARIRKISLVKQRVPRGAGVLGNPAGWRILKMGYASGKLHGEEEDARAGALVELSGENKRVRSWGGCVIKPAGIEGALVAGFTTSGRQSSWIDVEKEDGEVSFSAVCETEGVTIHPGAAIETESLYVGFHENPAAGLVSYSGLCAKEMGVRLKTPPSGWSAADAAPGGEMSQERILEMAQFLAARRRELPLEVVEVGGGFAKTWGDWLVPGEGFPDGLEKLARGIRERGLVPGIRLAPFAVCPSSLLAAEHPEWLLKDGGGNVISWEPRGLRSAPLNVLDASVAEARAWLTGLFGVLRGFGYRYFRLDYLFLGALKGKHSREGSRVEIYREAVKAIRRGAGDAYLSGLMAPFAPSVGLLDGVRVEGAETVSEGPREPAGEEHKRFYSHRSVWNNDPGPVRLINAESAEAAKAAAVGAAMAGGCIFSGDWLPSLSAERLEVISEALNARGKAPAIPLDLFERETPRVLASSLGGGKWRLGVFNADGYSRSVSVDLRGLGPGAGQAFLEAASGRKKLGKAGKVLVTPPIPAHGVVSILLEKSKS